MNTRVLRRHVLTADIQEVIDYKPVNCLDAKLYVRLLSLGKRYIVEGVNWIRSSSTYMDI